MRKDIFCKNKARSVDVLGYFYRRIRYEREKDITYEQAVRRMFEMLGDWKVMALASSVNDYVMVRNVSCLFYDEKIWFKTDKNFRKTKQLLENPHVALCWSGVQVEEIAINKGLVVDEPDRRFENKTVESKIYDQK